MRLEFKPMALNPFIANSDFINFVEVNEMLFEFIQIILILIRFNSMDHQ